MGDAETTIPVTVLTGFLGAGKTTMLRRILSDPGGVRYGILVNDFGEINIDAALIVESAADRISLSNGCVCCSIQTELVEAIRTLLAERPEIDRIIIEASGVSRSVPIADMMASEELHGLVSLDGMFCVVDAAAFPELDYAATELAIDQITGADLIVLNKTDLAAPGEVAAVRERLQGIMPHLRIVPAVQADIPRALLFGLRDGAENAQAVPCPQHGHGCGCDHAHGEEHRHHGEEHHHADAFASWSWRSAEALDETRLRAALRRLGAGLLRAKGVLYVEREGGKIPLEFQQVGKRTQLRQIEKAADPDSILVAIGLREQIDAAALSALLNGCASRPAARP